MNIVYELSFGGKLQIDKYNSHGCYADMMARRRACFIKITINYDARALSRLSSRVWKTPTAFSTFIPSKVIVANESTLEKGESLRLSFSRALHLSLSSLRHDRREQFPPCIADLWAISSRVKIHVRSALNNAWESITRLAQDYGRENPCMTNSR